MAECEKMMQLCEESLERTLTAEEQQALDRHLAECPACAAFLADLKFMTEALGELPEPPAGLHEKIMSGIRTESHTTVVQIRRPGRRMPMVAMLTAAAACVVLVLSGTGGRLMNHFNIASGGGSAASGAADSASPAALEESTDSEEGYADTADAGASIPQTTTKADQTEMAKYKAVPEKAAEPSDTPMESRSAPADAAEILGAGAPAPYSEDVLLPQVGVFISNVMNGEMFAACYLVEGGSNLPDIGQEQQRDSNFAYYVLDNNPAQLETLLDSLEKAGCTVGIYEESGVLFNETAKRVIFVVRMEEAAP